MYLLDTNVLSEFRKGQRCDENVRKWAESSVGDRHCISVLSLGEVRKGIENLRRKAPDQCPAFERWLEQLETQYERDILPVSGAVSDRWGRLMAEQTLPVIDGLLAATALEHRLTMVTRNIADFEPAGVEVINPFAATADNATERTGKRDR